MTQPAFWQGWDIARAIVAAPDENGGYLLDGFGAMHPFRSAPAVKHGPYWPGQDRARSVALGFDGHSGWVLDRAGCSFRLALHRRVDPRNSSAVTVLAVSVWVRRPHWGRGWRGRSFGRVRQRSGHPCGDPPLGGAPVVTGTGSWVGWDIARSIVLRAHGVSGYVLDGFGGHPGHGVATVIAGVPGIDHPVTVDVYRNVTKL